MKVELEVERKAKDLAFAIIENLKNQIRELSPKDRHSEGIRESLNSTLFEEGKEEGRSEFEESKNPFEIEGGGGSGGDGQIEEVEEGTLSSVMESFSSENVEEIFTNFGKDISSGALTLDLEIPEDLSFIQQISNSKTQLPDLEILKFENLPLEPPKPLLLLLKYSHPATLQSLHLNETPLNPQNPSNPLSLSITPYLPSLNSLLKSPLTQISLSSLNLPSDALSSLLKACNQVLTVEIIKSEIVMDNTLLLSVQGRYRMKRLAFIHCGNGEWNIYPQRFGYFAKAVKKCSLRFSLKVIDVTGCKFDKQTAVEQLEDHGIGQIEIIGGE